MLLNNFSLYNMQTLTFHFNKHLRLILKFSQKKSIFNWKLNKILSNFYKTLQLVDKSSKFPQLRYHFFLTNERHLSILHSKNLFQINAYLVKFSSYSCFFLVFTGFTKFFPGFPCITNIYKMKN